MSETSSRRPRSRPSLVDVARVAGVAPITVSRVANGHSSVQESTRRRVLEAMSKVGYHPNTAARALATGRFGTIGVITFTMATYGNAHTIAAIVASAERYGYAVSLQTAHNVTGGDVRGAFARLTRQAVDGVVVLVEARLLDGSGLRLPAGVPVVLATASGSSEYSAVDSDQIGGARAATEHLLGLGHRNVWHVAGPPNSFSARLRADSWRKTLRAAGVRPPRAVQGDWTAMSGYQQGKKLAAMPEVTAVFAANDQMALGAMRAMHEAGRSIPGDVSVVGFDDMAEAEAFWPPLTTVRQDLDRTGELCVEMLLQEINHEVTEQRTRIVPTELIVRDSTAPPPS